MPQYIFQHPETEEVKEIIQSMNDIHEYTDEKGIKWVRLFTNPTASIDTKIDPFSQKDFMDKTSKKRGTIGGIQDLAAEQSEKRAQKAGGLDPVREKYYEDYSKKRGGTKHKDVRQRELKEKIKNNPFIELA